MGKQLADAGLDSERRRFGRPGNSCRPLRSSSGTIIATALLHSTRSVTRRRPTMHPESAQGKYCPTPDACRRPSMRENGLLLALVSHAAVAYCNDQQRLVSGRIADAQPLDHAVERCHSADRRMTSCASVCSASRRGNMRALFLDCALARAAQRRVPCRRSST